jgi:hypothetical protein
MSRMTVITLNDGSLELFSQFIQLFQFDILKVILLEELKLLAKVAGFLQEFNGGDITKKTRYFFIPFIGLKIVFRRLRIVLVIKFETVLADGHLFCPLSLFNFVSDLFVWLICFATEI